MMIVDPLTYEPMSEGRLWMITGALFVLLAAFALAAAIGTLR